MLAFTTDLDVTVEIANVGTVTKGIAVPLARAALTMRELQDGSGEPLTGNDLRSAATAFAKTHDYLTVENADDDQVVASPPDIQEVSRTLAAQDFADHGPIPALAEGAVTADAKNAGKPNALKADVKAAAQTDTAKG